MPAAAAPLPRRGFRTAEYQRRCRRLQQKMAAAGVELALFTTAAEFYYFCGFHTPFWQSPTRPWFLLLPLTGKPIAVIPTIGAALMQQCHIQELRTWASPHPTDDGVSLLADTIRTTAGSSPTLGIMGGRQSILRMPPADFARLCDKLPAMRMENISDIVQQTRMIKSAAEIEKIATACRQASSVFGNWHEWLRPGMPARDIFREFKLRCLQAGVDDVSYLSGGIGSGGYADVIAPPTDAVFSRGDILMLDTGCTYDGYYCDFDRNIACQQAGSEAERCYDALWRATEAGLQAANAGARCQQVFHAMHEHIAAAGFAGNDSAAEVGRYGHGLGIELTETPSIAAWDNTPLAAGMVLALEPSAVMRGNRLMVHEENIVIGKNGKARLLSDRAAPQLPVLL